MLYIHSAGKATICLTHKTDCEKLRNLSSFAIIEEDRAGCLAFLLYAGCLAFLLYASSCLHYSVFHQVSLLSDLLWYLLDTLNATNLLWNINSLYSNMFS